MSEDFEPNNVIFAKNMFNHFDKDKDGYLNLSEFKQINLFYDESNETKCNTLDIEDLKEISKMFEFIRDEELIDEFNRIDSNNDGKISLEGIQTRKNILFCLNFINLNFK